MSWAGNHYLPSGVDLSDPRFVTSESAGPFRTAASPYSHRRF